LIVNSLRNRAAIWVVCTSIVAALTIAVAPSANAADQWGGIAAGPNGNWVIWFNKADKNTAAYFGNWAGCATPGANGETVLCKRLILFQKCGALAYNGSAFSPADGDSQADAESAATSDLPGSWIVGSACNDGGPAGKQSNYGQT
jgi:hypothetical protein